MVGNQLELNARKRARRMVDDIPFPESDEAAV